MPTELSPPRTVFVPHYHRFNPYQRLLSEALAALGVSVEMAIFKTRFPLLAAARGLDRHRDRLHVHWLDKAYADTRRYRYVLKILRTYLEIQWLRRCGPPLYYTAHNLQGHDADLPGLERWLHRALVHASRACFVHSEAARRKLIATYSLNQRDAATIAIAEHGNYLALFERVPSAAAARARHGLKPAQTVFLLFGLVRGYKDFSRLLAGFAAWNSPDAVLLIAGQAAAEDQQAILEAAARADPRVRLMLGAWPDQDLPALFAAADACVIPHDWQLTSGSLILAMGFGKPLLLPDRDLLGELPDLGGNLQARPDWTSAFKAYAALDTEQRRVLATANARRASELSWAKAAATIAAAYRQAVGHGD